MKRYEVNSGIFYRDPDTGCRLLSVHTIKCVQIKGFRLRQRLDIDDYSLNAGLSLINNNGKISKTANRYKLIQGRIH